MPGVIDGVRVGYCQCGGPSCLLVKILLKLVVLDGGGLKRVFEIAAGWVGIYTRIKTWGLLGEAGQADRKLHVLLTCHLLCLHYGLDVCLGPLDIDLLTVLRHPIMEVRIASKSLYG